MPGNFLLLDDDERAPLKAIDFGLAVPFDPEQPPRSDLGLEGTPWYGIRPPLYCAKQELQHDPDIRSLQSDETANGKILIEWIRPLGLVCRYMAPEVLSSAVGPQSDVWSAGVMAAQLLTGRLPFDDRHRPMNPSVTKIWSVLRSILRGHLWGLAELMSYSQQSSAQGPGACVSRSSILCDMFKTDGIL